MAAARLDDGQELLALNEVFVGHASHQSARYTLALGERAERQSSSGLIVATGTGATGWAASIHRERHSGLALPAPEDDRARVLRPRAVAERVDRHLARRGRARRRRGR